MELPIYQMAQCFRVSVTLMRISFAVIQRGPALLPRRNDLTVSVPLVLKQTEKLFLH